MRVLMLMALLAGCANPYEDAKKADTIEAWEAFLKTEPATSQKLFAEDRIEELMTKRAEESGKVVDWDLVISRFPESRHKKKLAEERVKAALKEAEAENTPEGWKRFAEQNPNAGAEVMRAAQNRIALANWGPLLVVGEPEVMQVNLAEDPKGPLDGWGFKATVTNNADKPIEYLNLELEFLDAEGKGGKRVTYPAVAGAIPGGYSLPEGFDKPIAKGETREWYYTTGDVPEGWAEGKKVKLVPVAIKPLAPN